jgi:hypothetical protein
MYPPVNVYITIENHHFYGKINEKWQFSIAMSARFVYQRVKHLKTSLGSWLELDLWKIGSDKPNSPIQENKPSPTSTWFWRRKAE